MNLIEIFFKGGFLMWVILGTSLIAVAIAVEKFMSLKKAKINTPSFLMKMRNLLKKRDVASAIALCMEEKTPTSNIIKKGLKKYKLGRERVIEAIDSAGRHEISKLERGLSTLATIAGAAPMLGFLGTVTGMIGAFMKIQELQGAAGPADLAGGIWEALITTAFGLFVGIPVLAVYNYLLSRVNKVVIDMEMIAADIIDVLDDTQKGITEEIEEEL
jgi:biopolymer transport protein ExbB